MWQIQLVPANNRVALITGATGAIGKAIARRIVGAGRYEVVLIARDSSKAAAVVEQLQRETQCRFSTDSGAVERLYEACKTYT